MRLPDEVRKCVVYIGVDVPGKGIHFGGTGFLIATKAKTVDGGFAFLVTAKHISDAIAGQDFYVRVNTKDGKFGVLKGAGKDAKWWYHQTDKAADVAVLPVTVDQNAWDVQVLTPDMFMDKFSESSTIGIGDEVYITGLFVHHKGNQKNMPIVRTGNIAMIPDERIDIKNFGPMEVYLIESRSIGGLSGSPVFVIERRPDHFLVLLWGMIHGHWDVTEEKLIDGQIQDAQIKAGVNVGVAMVTPAHKILEVLNGDELVKWCTEIEEKEISKTRPPKA